MLLSEQALTQKNAAIIRIEKDILYTVISPVIDFIHYWLRRQSSSIAGRDQTEPCAVLIQSARMTDAVLSNKLAILDYMHTHHLSSRETGIKFGIRGCATVWEWEQKYLKNGINGLEPKKKGRRPKRQKPKRPLTQVEQLLEENEYLRAENEYLKKLNALVAEREKRERGNR